MPARIAVPKPAAPVGIVVPKTTKPGFQRTIRTYVSESPTDKITPEAPETTQPVASPEPQPQPHKLVEDDIVVIKEQTHQPVEPAPKTPAAKSAETQPKPSATPRGRAAKFISAKPAVPRVTRTRTAKPVDAEAAPAAPTKSTRTRAARPAEPAPVAGVDPLDPFALLFPVEPTPDEPAPEDLPAEPLQPDVSQSELDVPEPTEPEPAEVEPITVELGVVEDVAPTEPEPEAVQLEATPPEPEVAQPEVHAKRAEVSAEVPPAETAESQGKTELADVVSETVDDPEQVTIAEPIYAEVTPADATTQAFEPPEPSVEETPAAAPEPNMQQVAVEQVAMQQVADVNPNEHQPISASLWLPTKRTLMIASLAAAVIAGILGAWWWGVLIPAGLFALAAFALSWWSQVSPDDAQPVTNPLFGKLWWLLPALAVLVVLVMMFIRLGSAAADADTGPHSGRSPAPITTATVTWTPMQPSDTPT